MLARKRFRLSLYKLMLLKNLLENKVHKEKMQMLFAFEQMIINTEDVDNDPDYYDEVYGDENNAGDEDRDYDDGQGGDEGLDGYGDEEDDMDLNDRDLPLAALSYYQRYKKFPPMQRIPIEAEYMSNPSDVIDEEEFEDSETDPASPLKRFNKFQLPKVVGTVAPVKPIFEPSKVAFAP